MAIPITIERLLNKTRNYYDEPFVPHAIIHAALLKTLIIFQRCALGGPLSPLLANIFLLNELDRELERRGHIFVRYADDVLILKVTRKAAERTRDTITEFIEKQLFLKVNREKTIIVRINQNVKYLGYGFYKTRGEWHFRVHPKSKAKLKELGWTTFSKRYELVRS